jgi:hypothetical protein
MVLYGLSLSQVEALLVLLKIHPHMLSTMVIQGFLPTLAPKIPCVILTKLCIF